MARKARISAALLALFDEGAHHLWTLEELHGVLARRGTTSDFSSVFRAVEKLAASGAVRRLVLDDGRARFERAGDHHDHLFCTHCREISAVPCLVDRSGFRALERATGAAIADHHVVLTGICGKCRRGGGSRRRA